MTWNEWKLGNEFAFVDVEVSPTDTASFDFDEDVIGSQLRNWHFFYGVNLWLAVFLPNPGQYHPRLHCVFTIPKPSSSLGLPVSTELH